MLKLFLLALAATLVSALLTGLIRHYALAHRVLDIPNQRSSHTVPTARGGGLSIVAVFLASSLYLYLNRALPLNGFLALNMALPVAGIGWLDDHQPIAARWRFLVHILAAAGAVFFLQGGNNWLLLPAPLDMLADRTLLAAGWYGFLPAALFLAWFLNLFNFMDGIDGLAGSEALFLSLGFAAFLYFQDPVLSKLAVMLAAASLGFLLWNWPKASIFMGDVGSGFLGLLLGIIMLMATKQVPVLLYSGLILAGIFVVDASYTLCIRFYSGQKWYAAHRSHAYQHAAARYGHLRVLLAAWAINLGWLLPISVFAYANQNLALFCLLIAYLPLLYLANRFRAGCIETET